MARGRVSYANVMATIAMFIALGGSSYAISRINGRDIAPRTITGSKLKRDTVSSKEIGARAVGASELSSGVLNLLVRTGTRGPTG